MKRIKGILMIAAFSVLVMGLPAIASAQYGNGGYYPNQYPNGNNGGYGNNGYYGDIRSTLRDLRDRAKNFERTVDRDKNAQYNNGGGWGGYGNGGYSNNSYKDLKKALDRFSDATKDLDNQYDNGRDLNKSADEAQRTLTLASQIDQMLYNFGRNNNWQGEWSGIQRDLSVVANTYGYNYNNRGNNRGRNNNGGWTRGNRNGSGGMNLPSWWPF